MDIAKKLNSLRSLVSMGDQIDSAAASRSIRENVQFKGVNVFILAFAILIASLGLNLNSIPVIIGAMLISPLMGPILGFGLGLGTNDTGLIRTSLANFGIMVAISICVSTVYFLISPLNLTSQTELLARTNPTIYDVLVALFGGAAGMFENARRDKGQVLSGVAIATALMPPLCTVGYGIAHLNLHFIAGALYLFIINSIFIALATILVVKYLHFPSALTMDDEKSKKQKRIIGVIMFIIIIPSIFSAVNIIKSSNFDRSVQTLVEKNKSLGRSYIYNYQTNHDSKPATVEIFVAGEALGLSERERLYSDAENLGIMRNQLFISETAAVKSGSGLDADIVRGIYQQNTETIQSLNKTIAEMDTALQEYKSREVPVEMLAKELRSQYDTVVGMFVSRGKDVNAENGTTKETVVAVIESRQGLSPAQMGKIEKWLKVRLSTEEVLVFQSIYEAEKDNTSVGSGAAVEQ